MFVCACSCPCMIPWLYQRERACVSGGRVRSFVLSDGSRSSVLPDQMTTFVRMIYQRREEKVVTASRTAAVATCTAAKHACMKIAGNSSKNKNKSTPRKKKNTTRLTHHTYLVSFEQQSTYCRSIRYKRKKYDKNQTNKAKATQIRYFRKSMTTAAVIRCENKKATTSHHQSETHYTRSMRSLIYFFTQNVCSGGRGGASEK